MYRLIICLLVLLLVSCSFSNKKKNENIVMIDLIESRQDNNDEDFKTIRFDYGDNLILKSFYFIDREEKLNLYNWDKLELENDWINFENKINLTLKEYPNLINNVFNEIINRPDKDNLINLIKYWCDTYIILQSHTKYDSVLYFEKIIFEIPKTKDLLKSFLSDKSQSWDSLSSSQIYELYYMVCNSIYKLSNKEKVQFYSDFFKLLSKQVTQQE